MTKKIKLGSKVRCKITGFEGTAVVFSEFINGCIQYTVVGKSKDGKMPDELGIDAESLEVIKPEKKVKIKKKKTGGPMTEGISMRGY